MANNLLTISMINWSI